MHNEQYDEDHSIPDDQWAAILVRPRDADALAAEMGAVAQRALRALGTAQAAWLNRLCGRIAKLDLEIAAAS